MRDLKLDRLRATRLEHPAWIGVFILFITADYALRGYRWWYMLRSVRAKYTACVRVLLTSLAANNILPFRVGDFMRIFAYAPDVNAPSSTVLSTVLLERLLDIFMLCVFLIGVGLGAKPLTVELFNRELSIIPAGTVVLVIAALGLGLLLFGTRLLQRITNGLVRRFGQGPRTKKLGEWAVLLFDAVLHLTLFGRVWLLVISAGVWFCESVVFVSCAKMMAIPSDKAGPWLAASLSNLSFMIPSAPGGVGPFEASAKRAMSTQGAQADDAAVYALLAHVLIWFAITAVGGILFLIHRAARGLQSRPLAEDLAALPKEMQVPEDEMPGMELPETH